MEPHTIYSKFKEIAIKHPNDPAIIEDDRVLTYAELDRLADGIMAKFYDSRPIFVGIVMHHGAEQIAAMLAVLKSGAAYVPAEPTLPQERIDYMMQTAGVRLIITDNYCRHIEPAPKDETTADGRPVYESLGFSNMPDIMKYKKTTNYAELKLKHRESKLPLLHWQ